MAAHQGEHRVEVHLAPRVGGATATSHVVLRQEHLIRVPATGRHVFPVRQRCVRVCADKHLLQQPQLARVAAQQLLVELEIAQLNQQPGRERVMYWVHDAVPVVATSDHGRVILAHRESRPRPLLSPLVSHLCCWWS